MNQATSSPADAPPPRSAAPPKRALITGGNSGMGYQVALTLLKKGYEVTLACRDDQRSAAARAELLKAVPSGVVNTEHLDLADLASIRECAARLEDQEPFDVLHNNAGVLSRNRRESKDGFELHLAVNFLGHYLLTSLLLPRLLAANKPVRIVLTASAVHQMSRINFDDLMRCKYPTSYFSWEAYGQSKLAVIMWGYELARRLEGTNITVNCVHPGVVNTQLGRAFAAVMLGKYLASVVSPILFRTPEQGARVMVYAASAPDMEGVTGQYLVDRRSRRSSYFSYDGGTARRLLVEAERLTGTPPVAWKMSKVAEQ